MCTVTLLVRGHGLQITMNRDEQRRRPPEEAPTLWPHTGITAPRDARAQGTWIGMIETGHWACVLNSYAPYTPPGEPPSRGQVIAHVLASTAPRAALETLPLAQYRPFRIIVGHRQDWQVLHWNGDRLETEMHSNGKDFMQSSSSWEAAMVLPKRQQAFAAWLEMGSPHDEQGLPSIHRWQEPGEERSSILMARPESHTTSITQIRMPVAGAPSMHYWPADAVSPWRLV